MWSKMANFADRFIAKFIPESFPLSFVLLILVMILSLFLTDTTLPQIFNITGYGTASLLAFSMQIVLNMVLGYVFAQAPPIKKLLVKVAKSLKGNAKCIFWVAVISNIIHWINVTVGMLAAAVLANEVIRNNKEVRPGLVVAAAYAGMIPSAIGFSPAIISTVATQGNEFMELMGGQIVPRSLTSFNPAVLGLSAVLVFGMAIVFSLMAPKDYVNPLYVGTSADLDEQEGYDTAEQEYKKDAAKFVVAMENGSIWPVICGAVILAGGIAWFVVGKCGVTFDWINCMLLGGAIMAWGNMIKFGKCTAEACKTMWGVVACYPIYACIMKLMTDSGLGGVMSEWIVSISTADTLPVFTYLSAGLVNIFVPSAGGQWAVQAPFVAPAAISLGTDMWKAVIPVALGDCWTNMLQPFWAIPILGICRVKVKEMIPYTFAIAVFAGVVGCLWFGIVFPFF